VPVPQTDTGR
jgi:hypothetical protein